MHSVQPNFSFQTGDPIGPGSSDADGGCSIWGLLDPADPGKKNFAPEFKHSLKHAAMGTVSMATAPNPDNPDERYAGSQFIITLGTDIDFLDGKAAIFGTVVEGFDALDKINNAYVDDKGRPLKDIRILHTVVLDDPYDDPAGLVEPPESPVPSAAQLATVRVAYDESLEEETDPEALEKVRREREARAQALTLEMVGDLPFAEVAPPENVLFVCKLNPVTQDEDLELIFSRFGKIVSCEVIRDKRTGDSLTGFPLPRWSGAVRIGPALSASIRCMIPVCIKMADGGLHMRGRYVRYEYATALDILTRRCRLEYRTSKSLL